MAKDSRLWEEAYKATPKIKVKSYKKQPKRAPYVPPSEVAGELAVKQRLTEIARQMRVLKAERHQLKKRLKPWLVEYEKKPYQLYALRLQNSCWYVGISRSPERRFLRHGTPKGANWTSEHKPIEIHETRMTKVYIESEAVKLEDDMTLEYAMKYGSEFVRGGGYCQRKPHWPALIIQNEKPS